ncbi:MAG: methionyl-tRNA formyltransferase [Bacteroidales bacterium]|nr:methionyl-tRNA formyltransferase [Bacteroidales bacterium]
MAGSKIRGIFHKTRIVFMGTPEFAVAPLDALVRKGYDIAAVVTVADKPSGRGLKVNESAVKKYAVEHSIKCLQPLKLKDPAFLSELASLKADMFVVVAFRMLPEEVWAMPKLGTFNLHAALLPQYRGAAPINWAVINGERITGATTFMIDKNIDTGGIILRQELRIKPDDTAGDIHDALRGIGTDLVLETVEGIIQHNVEMRTQRSLIQGSEVLKAAPKLTPELLNIDWNDSTTEIYNLIRGLSPYPTAYTLIAREGSETLQMKIFRAEKMDLKAAPGTILSDSKTYLAIATEDGAISVKDLQLSGKKRMAVEDFLRGWRDPQLWRALPGTSKDEKRRVREI